ncbi:hypothetical protein CASFOL_033005 [Castilleja foliolosa]|uniref:Uncharacterized protein n=1 Tax=Castilleja foliolosa TaxID=1961234 RepID=A0ABD3C4F6_9LAMI
MGNSALSVCFVWFLLLSSLVDCTRVDINLKQMSTHDHHNYVNLNYVSKRRIPHGPDPIHNKRTGSSKLPPT